MSLEKQAVTPEWLNENLGDYSRPWEGANGDADLEKASQSMTFNRRRKLWVQRSRQRILRSPIVPLIIRLTVWFFSLIALALGGSIHHISVSYKRPQGPSAEMAIIVDAVALVYLVYITYDEYTGKPLGLRPARAKIRLVFLDLFFIVFAAANTSLAFASLTDVTGSCTESEVNQIYDPRNSKICGRQKALATILLLGLLSWLMTFAISVLR